MCIYEGNVIMFDDRPVFKTNFSPRKKSPKPSLCIDHEDL